MSNQDTYIEKVDWNCNDDLGNLKVLDWSHPLSNVDEEEICDPCIFFFCWSVGWDCLPPYTDWGLLEELIRPNKMG